MTRETRSTTAAAPASLRQAFEAEKARRADERRAREEAERAQQEADLAHAAELHDLLGADPGFLADRGITLDRRRYTVTLDHADFRISAYFEAGAAAITSADKRSATTSAAPRKQQTVDTVQDALLVIAHYLADEIR